MLVCALFVHIAHETAGAARTRPSLRPLIGEGGKFLANLGRIEPRDREAVSAGTRCLKIEFGSMCDDRRLVCRLLCRPLNSATPKRENARGERAFSVVDLG